MISPQYVTDTVSRALLEDVGTGDLTASLIAVSYTHLTLPTIYSV